MAPSASKPVWRLACAVLIGLGCESMAAEFSPYKDALFDYPQPVASRDGGRILDVPYSERRDIDERDEIPERRVRSSYVDMAVARSQREGSFAARSGALRYATVGDERMPSTIFVFVHGRNGDRRLGMNDWTFGGNFNRLKNIVARNGGLYLTVDAGSLGAGDAERVGELVADLSKRHAGARIVMACASMGGQVCWTVAAGSQAAAIDAMVLLGSDSDLRRFEAIRAARASPMPLLIAHGTRDKVYGFAKQLSFVETVRRQRPDYPIRFVGFDDGNHGTPIRMIDWRDTLNWLAEVGR